MEESDRIREIVAEVTGVAVDELSDDTSLEQLLCDSLDLLELTVALEEEYDIAIKDESLQKCDNIGNLISLVIHYIES